MFCSKCGKELSNNSEKCAYCGADLTPYIKKEKGQFASEEGEFTVYVSANPIQKNQPQNISSTVSTKKSIKPLLWSAVGLISLIVMSFNYAVVSIQLTYTTSDSSLSGFDLLDCMDGSLKTAALMMILLIIANVAIIATGIVLYSLPKYKKYALNAIIPQSVLSSVASFVALINIHEEMDAVNTLLINAYVGVGAYLNLILCIASIIFAVYLKKMIGETK